MTNRITVAYGDGIGPEIMDASLKIMEAAGADLSYDVIEIGEKCYLEGHTSGIRPEDWEKIVSNKIFFKAPITTPQGGGYKSLNVTIRKTLGLFSNIRPVQSFHPFVKTKHSELDLVVIRENEEDLYAGIEHRQTQEVYQCLKLMSRSGCERIIRYAFEYARHMGRKKVTCMTKDNIMKMTDGLFRKVFNDIREEYPEIESDHLIIDIGAARLADTPENFDVIVLPNLYGDIVSDIIAQISGSVGLAGSCNVGKESAMFEAIHGSAPDIAGQDKANPSALLMAGVMMLNHLGQVEVANKIKNAWLKAIEDGIATPDIFSEVSTGKVGTKGFVEEVIRRLGQQPEHLPAAATQQTDAAWDLTESALTIQERKLEGIDVFLYEENRDPEYLGNKLAELSQHNDLVLQMVTNRGIKVFPNGNPQTYCTDHWRCRFKPGVEGNPLTQKQLMSLLTTLTENNFDIIKTEMLYSFDGELGYSLAQGQ